MVRCTPEEVKQNLEVEIKNHNGAVMTACYGRKSFKQVQEIIAALGKEPDNFSANAEVVSIRW
jgi:hypothetical protein